MGIHFLSATDELIDYVLSKVPAVPDGGRQARVAG